ncbi:MAG: glycine hydroxymethyltransferase [Chitinispirillales bacterium]|jgi:glycine hydroxymethyltransferase|nr:glycine hydroxymethyltransferase [Chitinispirillales bacterium]
MSALQEYILSKKNQELDAGAVAYVANLEKTAQVNPDIAKAIIGELEFQRTRLKLIASENYCSLSSQLTMGNLLTDKYAEGFPFSRFYEGCDNVDTIESIAVEKAKELFGAQHAFVQPHSGADANMVAFWGILQAKIAVVEAEKLPVKNPLAMSHDDWEKIRVILGNQKLLGLDLSAGGHLTHGYRLNISGRMFDAYSYGVSEKDGLLDYDEIEKKAMEIKPLILLAGYSAYPRKINFKKFREIADKSGAVLMVDMAHFAGLVAGKVFEGEFDPVKWADVVTTTTHKTLRGPRGGIVLCKKEFAEFMDKGCPLVLGGPLAHVMAAKAIAFTEALKPEFREYAKKIVSNSKSLAQACKDEGMEVVSGGTDNHLFLIDAVKSFGLSGRQAAGALFECGVTLNKNSIPFDKENAMITSGLRVGTAAVSTLGMGEYEMKEIAKIFSLILRNTKAGVVEKGENAGKPSKISYIIDEKIKVEAKEKVKSLLAKFVLYPELDLEFLKKRFG